MYQANHKKNWTPNIDWDAETWARKDQHLEGKFKDWKRETWKGCATSWSWNSKGKVWAGVVEAKTTDVVWFKPFYNSNIKQNFNSLIIHVISFGGSETLKSIRSCIDHILPRGNTSFNNEQQYQ